jgi:PKD repeat protein
MNFFRNCREVTIEISDVHLLPESQLVDHWNYNYRSFLNHIEESGYGLRGLVTDSMSGVPLNARIYISGFDKDSSHVYTDPQVGDYHRLLKGGIYTVTYSAAGYFPKTFTVQVADKQTTLLDVQLYNGRLETNFTADTTIRAVDQSVHFTDQSAGYPQTWLWTFEAGVPSSSTEANPVITYSQPGTYAVKLLVTRPGSVDSLVRNEYIEVKPWYLMGNKTYTVCDGRFFDSGGPTILYADNENYVETFYPSEQSKKLTAFFNSIDIEEGGTDCSNDRLLVFDGESVSGNPVATLCGNSIPDQITATNPSGALTFQFESNASNSLPGWDITISCDSNVGITENIRNSIRIYPNPVISGLTFIETDSPIQMLIIRDITGRILNTSTPLSNSQLIECNWPSGIYLFQIKINDRWISKKIQVLSY